jgi:hypothetical protein
MTLSTLVPLVLGALHLIYTFSGPRLLPRDPALQARMNEVNRVITRETTVWRAWIGFNASHSMGAILFGLVYGFLANAHPGLLFNSPFLLVVGFAMRRNLSSARPGRLTQEAPPICGQNRFDAEKDDVLGAQWWSLEEIAASSERFYPKSLAQLLPAFLRGEAISEPLEVWP